MCSCILPVYTQYSLYHKLITAKVQSLTIGYPYNIGLIVSQILWSGVLHSENGKGRPTVHQYQQIGLHKLKHERDYQTRKLSYRKDDRAMRPIRVP